MSAISRKGNVVCMVIGEAQASTLAGFVTKMVSEKVDLVATDESPAYDYVRVGMRHEAVHRSKGGYVRGEVHTNNIESFWSLIEHGVVGSYHQVSKKHSAVSQ